MSSQTVAEPVTRGTARVRWRRVVHLALPAVVVFLVVNAFYLGVAQSNGYPYFSSLTWSRWDTGWYVKIARFGYDIYSCKRMGLDPATYCAVSIALMAIAVLASYLPARRATVNVRETTSA